MHISLTPHLEALVRAKVESGMYNNASEVIREALRVMAAHDELYNKKLEILRLELEKGESALSQGQATSIETDDDLREMFARL